MIAVSIVHMEQFLVLQFRKIKVVETLVVHRLKKKKYGG